jgi:hypothetical protein
VDNISNWHTDSGKSWNDTVSSLKVGKNTKVILYENKDYGGSNILLQGDGSNNKNIPKLSSINMKKNTSWNDQVTSLKVRMSDFYQ